MKKVAILIPAHNEQLVIAQTLQSVRKFLPAGDIYVVNDGSLDQSAQIAKKFTKNVLNLSPNRGKATALNLAIDHFKLTQKYQYIMPLDADTTLTDHFFDNALPILEKDKRNKIACVVGKVVGKSLTWVTVYRVWEYEVAQTIHKNAQGIIDAILVCPGCSTIYRSEIFKNVQIPTGTITEDMDFTFLIHRQKLGKVIFTGKAVVITQDPDNMADFIRQIDRWYTGFWQCVLKHNIPWQGQTLDLEVAMLALEGLYGSLVTIMLFIFIPLTLIAHKLILLLAPLGFDLLFFILPTVILTATRYKSFKIFKFIPNLYLLRVVGSLIFLKSFLKVVLGLDLTMVWKKVTRYKIEEEQPWLNPFLP